MKIKFEKAVDFGSAHILPRTYKNLRNLPHWHREHELIFVESGEIELSANGVAYRLTQGNAAFLHSEDIHGIASLDNAVVTVVKADDAYFKRIVDTKRLSAPVLRGDYMLEDFFAEVFAELKGPKEYGELIADGAATKLFSLIFRQERTEARPSRVNATEQYKHLLDKISREYPYITFGDAAEFMHFSKPYFSEFFCARTGASFTYYLNTVKIAAAVEQVTEGKSSITEISKACGFNTIRNFNRVFKELTGYTPRTLPKDYRFIRSLKEYKDNGFDPTLHGSEILEK